MSDYRRLESAEIVRTALAVRDRVASRFAGRGLAGMSSELVRVCEGTVRVSEWLARPRWLLRILVGALVAFFFVALGAAVFGLRVKMNVSTASELVQGVQAAIQNLVFVGIAVAFLGGLERRWKRKRSLGALKELRSMAHIIDMHQLTKDPERFPELRSAEEEPAMATPELIRYLDYCSDMLSIISKAAALTIQAFDDPVTLVAVNEIENLTSGLSRKIWQKIMILDRIAAS
jgi:hypothetical protein